MIFLNTGKMSLIKPYAALHGATLYGSHLLKSDSELKM